MVLFNDIYSTGAIPAIGITKQAQVQTYMGLGWLWIFVILIILIFAVLWMLYKIAESSQEQVDKQAALAFASSTHDDVSTVGEQDKAETGEKPHNGGG